MKMKNTILSMAILCSLFEIQVTSLPNFQKYGITPIHHTSWRDIIKIY